MKRFGGPFLAKSWVEQAIVRAEPYAASALVISAEFTSRPGRLGSPKAYLVVGQNEFHLALPTSFDVEQIIDVVLGPQVRPQYSQAVSTKQVDFQAKVGRRKLRAALRSGPGGLELVIQLPFAS